MVLVVGPSDVSAGLLGWVCFVVGESESPAQKSDA